MEGAATTTMASLLTEISSVFTTAMGNVGEVVETVVANPLLLLPCALMFGGYIIGICKRLTTIA